MGTDHLAPKTFEISISHFRLLKSTHKMEIIHPRRTQVLSLKKLSFSSVLKLVQYFDDPILKELVSDFDLYLLFIASCY